jgi:hypothetical protein
LPVQGVSRGPYVGVIDSSKNMVLGHNSRRTFGKDVIDSHPPLGLLAERLKPVHSLAESQKSYSCSEDIQLLIKAEIQGDVPLHI